jgi:uncharacterized damage-inducible protein DinB
MNFSLFYFLFKNNNYERFFKEILVYQFQMNEKIIEIFENNPDKISEKAHLLFSHSTNSHHIWNARILGNTPKFGVWELTSIEIIKEKNKNNLETSFEILDSLDLETKISYQNSDGENFVKSLKDIIFHICNHSTYHRAQIATELKINNITPSFYRLYPLQSLKKSFLPNEKTNL